MLGYNSLRHIFNCRWYESIGSMNGLEMVTVRSVCISDFIRFFDRGAHVLPVDLVTCQWARELFNFYSILRHICGKMSGSYIHHSQPAWGGLCCVRQIFILCFVPVLCDLSLILSSQCRIYYALNNATDLTSGYEPPLKLILLRPNFSQDETSWILFYNGINSLRISFNWIEYWVLSPLIISNMIIFCDDEVRYSDE